GSIPTRMGNEHPSLYPYEPFPTAEGDLIVAVGNDSQFDRLCTLLGAPELASDDRFATMWARNVNRAELRPILSELLASRTAGDWFDALTDIGVPAAPIQDVRQGVEFAEKLGLNPVAIAGDGER